MGGCVKSPRRSPRNRTMMMFEHTMCLQHIRHRVRVQSVCAEQVGTCNRLRSSVSYTTDTGCADSSHYKIKARGAGKSDCTDIPSRSMTMSAARDIRVADAMERSSCTIKKAEWIRDEERGQYASGTGERGSWRRKAGQWGQVGGVGKLNMLELQLLYMRCVAPKISIWFASQIRVTWDRRVSRDGV